MSRKFVAEVRRRSSSPSLPPDLESGSGAGAGDDNGGNLDPLVRSVSFAHAALPFASLFFVIPLGSCRSLGGVATTGPPSEVVVATGAMGGPRTRAESRLDNGVRVVVEENHAAPVVAVQVWVAAGAADDPPALPGAAHLYEHLVFRGTQHRAPGAAAREIAAAGGTIGAWTGLDETVYHLTLAAPFLEAGLDVLGDALTAPTFDPAELEREKKLIALEISRAAIDPARAPTELLRASAFAGGRYGRPLLGTPEAVAAEARDALVAHFAETYVGDNITVVVVGDVDARAARAAVARAFAAVPRGRSTVVAPAAATPASGPRVVLSTAPGLEARVAVGFRVASRLASLDTQEAAALDLLTALLTRGDTARLAHELRDNRQVATAVHGLTFQTRGGALLALTLTPAPQRLEAAAQGTIDEALRLAREEVPADELDRVRGALASDLAREDDGAEGRARRLGFAAAIAADDRYDERYRAALRALDPPKLRAAAAKLLRPEALSLAVLDPGGPHGGSIAAETGRFQAIVSGAAARAEPPHIAAAPVEGSGDVVRVVTPAGLRILVLRDRGAPLVTLEAAWAGGARAEDSGSNGAGALIAALLTRGTRTRSASQIEGDAAVIGGKLTGFSDRDHLGLRAELLPGSWSRGLALLADCLLRPSFPAAEIDDSRRIVVDRGRHDLRDPLLEAARLFRQALWPGHPFRLDPLGSAQSLAALGRVRLLDHYRRHYPVSRLVISVVGDVDPKAVVATLTALFAEAPVGAPPPELPPAPIHTEPVALFHPTDLDVAEIVLGYPGPDLGDPDRPALEVLAEILAPEGRLRKLFGGKSPLVFGVGARAASGVEPGYLAVEADCDPANVDAAVAAIRGILDELVTGGVTAAEAAEAARRLAGRRALELRGQAAIADALALDEAYGLGLMSYRNVPAALARVTAADVNRALRRFIAPKRETIAVVRPEVPAAMARTSQGAR